MKIEYREETNFTLNSFQLLNTNMKG